MYHAKQIFFIIAAGDDKARVLVFLQQRPHFAFRRAQIDMLNIVARGHNTADRTLVEIEHALNHPSLLRVEDLLVILIDQHRGGTSIQLGIFFITA